MARALFRPRLGFPGLRAAPARRDRRVFGRGQERARGRARAPARTVARGRCGSAATSSARRCSGIEETARLPAEAYAPEATREVYRRIEDKARRALAAGVSGRSRRHIRHRARRALRPAASRPRSVSLSTALSRGAARDRLARSRPARDASDADAGVARRQSGRADRRARAGRSLARLRGARRDAPRRQPPVSGPKQSCEVTARRTRSLDPAALFGATACSCRIEADWRLTAALGEVPRDALGLRLRPKPRKAAGDEREWT